MRLEDLSPEAVLELNIPTGAPLFYDMDDNGAVTAHRYL